MADSGRSGFASPFMQSRHSINNDAFCGQPILRYSTPVASDGGGLMGSLVSMLLLHVASAFAAPYQPESAPDDEIIVTGERIARALRNTPSSVNVFTSKELDLEPGARELGQLFEAIPNVQIGTENQGPAIRGQDSTGVLSALPAFLGGARPRTTLNVDGRATSYNEFIFGKSSLWDVEQVEVFRSPQSTVEGRNSIAGTVYVRTKSPTFSVEGAARAIGNDKGDAQLSAVVSGPVIQDRLAMRLAADWRKAEPSSELSGTINGANPNRNDYRWARLKMLVVPGWNRDARIELSLQHLWSLAPQSVTVRTPFSARQDRFVRYGVFRNRVSSATLRSEVELGDGLDSTTILSASRSNFRRFAPAGTGEAMNRVNDWSVEQRVTWGISDEIKLSAGVHMLRSDLDQKIDLRTIIGLGNFVDHQRSLGVFGEATWTLIPDLTVNASIRRQTDLQDRTGSIVGPNADVAIDYRKRFSFWLPRAGIDWDIDEAIRVGAFIQRASIPGGTSLNFDTGLPETFDAETLWNKEIYVRARMSGGRLNISANLFHNAHHDAQRAVDRLFSFPNQPSLGWYELYNLPRARTMGAEASVQWKISSRLVAGVGLGLLDTKITKNAAGAPPFDGNQFARSPHRSTTVSVQWKPTERLSLSARLRSHSAYFSDDRNDPIRKIPAATEIDARGEYDFDDATLFAYARNITDKLSLTYLNSPFFGAVTPPREVGAGLEIRF